MSNLNQKAINHFITKYAGKVLDEQTVKNLVNEISTTTLNIEAKKSKKINFFNAADNMTVLLQERLDFYNYVVRNTKAKFHNQTALFSAEDVIFPKDGKFVGFSRVEDETEFSHNITDAIRKGEKTLTPEDYVLFRIPDIFNHMRAGKIAYSTATTKIVKIKVKFLLNDPIVIAQHVRKIITGRIEEGIQHIREEAEKAVEESRTNLEKNESRLAANNEIVAKWEKQQARKLDSRTKKKVLKDRRKAEKVSN